MLIITIFSRLLGLLLLFHVHPIKTTSPNIVLVLTDDLDSQLDGITPLLKTRSRLKNQGRTYKNAFATTPICCPSRSSILTGLRQEHTRVWNNSISGNCGNQDWINGPEASTFATFAQKYKYKTAYFGKYLNQYGRTEKDPLRIPKGWNHWVGLVGNSKYYNYTLSVNGHPERHGDDYEKDYLTDVLKRKSLDFLKSHLESSSQKNPFLMVLATPSPHAPFTPAPQYSDKFSDLKAPRIPNFNYVKDKKHWLARKDPLSNQLIDVIDEIFRNRWRTLLSVDDLVDEVMEFLDQKNVLSNTYVIFTSDHGYHLGQYGLVVDKRMPYETDIRIPFFLYGPGIQPSTESKDVILNIDIAPTILDMMNVREEEYNWMDGSSILRQHSRNEFQIEYHGEHGSGIDKTCDIYDRNVSDCYSLFGCNCQDSKNNTYICKRRLDEKNNFKHCWFLDSENFEEIYDLSKDPYELYNLYNYMSEPQVIIVK